MNRLFLSMLIFILTELLSIFVDRGLKSTSTPKLLLPDGTVLEDSNAIVEFADQVKILSRIKSFCGFIRAE